MITVERERTARPGLLDGVWVFERQTFHDERGFFHEAFRLDEVEASVGRPLRFVQMNHSRSRRGALRGLHAEQWDKLVYLTAGHVVVALADLRPASPTFAQIETHWLDESARLAVFIPAGVAHGYCVVSEQADYTYQVTAYYDGTDQRAVAWDDPDLGVPWPIADPIVSERDRTAPRLRALFPELFSNSNPGPG